MIDGHSNHGAGPAFKGMQTETVEDFMNVSGVGHCIFNKQQEEMPKFNPAAHPDATSVSKNEYGEIGKFYKVPCGKEDLPTLRYAVLYLNSCLSDRYFSSVFTHGVLITSTALNCAKQSSADMLEGLLLGDDEKRLLKRINDVKDLDNTNNYHTIYIDGKPLK